MPLLQSIASTIQVPSMAPIWPVDILKSQTTNSSNKEWVVPDGEQWWVLSAHAIYTTNGTAGNRLVNIQERDTSNVVMHDVAAGAVQAASLTNHYAFQQGIYHETGFTLNEIQVPIPVMWVIPATNKLRVFDQNAVAAAGAGENLLVNVRIVRWRV